MPESSPTSQSTPVSPTVASSTRATAATSPGQPPSGKSAMLAAAMAIMGVATALFPNAPVVCALTSAIPQLRVALPVVLTAVGSIWAAISHPPFWGRGGGG